MFVQKNLLVENDSAMKFDPVKDVFYVYPISGLSYSWFLYQMVAHFTMRTTEKRPLFYYVHIRSKSVI